MIGYTWQLIEKQLSFPDFARLCARAFGALYHTKEEGLDVPIPKELEPNAHYLNRLRDAFIQEARLNVRPEEEWNKLFLSYKASCIQDMETGKKESQAKRDYMKNILTQVLNWEIPTEDHKNLKDFMIEQLESSIESVLEDGWYDDQINKYETMTLEEWKEQEYDNLRRNIVFYAEAYSDEVKRVNKCNVWIKELHQSLENYDG